MDASISLLDVFYLNPSLARTEIAPQLFEELFLRHFLPVLEWYNEQRSRILSSLSLNSGYESDDRSICGDAMVVSCTTLLSKMNGDQASELKGLERDYEEVLDVNCKVFVGYFKEVLESNDGDRVIDPPSVVLETIGNGDEFEYGGDERIEAEESGLKNGRYNVMLTFQNNASNFSSSIWCFFFALPLFFIFCTKLDLSSFHNH